MTNPTDRIEIITSVRRRWTASEKVRMVEEKGKVVFRHACLMGLEGIVSGSDRSIVPAGRRTGSSSRTRRRPLCRWKRIGEGAAMKTRTHFGHRIDMLDREGEIVEHLAGVEDSLLADATYEAALRRWPKVAIILRQGARVIRDSRKPRLVK
jgi:hypothetical protein